MEALDGIGTWAYCPSPEHVRTPGWHIYELIELSSGKSFEELVRRTELDDPELIEAEIAGTRQFLEESARVAHAVNRSATRLVEYHTDEDVAEVLRYLGVRFNMTVLKRMERLIGVLGPTEYQGAGKMVGRIVIPRNSIVIGLEVVPGLYSGLMLFRPMFGEFSATSIIQGRLNVPGTLGVAWTRALWESDPSLPIIICDPFHAIELASTHFLDQDRTPPVIAYNPIFGPRLHPGLIRLLRASGRELVVWVTQRDQSMLQLAKALSASIVYYPSLRIGLTAGFLGSEGIVRELAARAGSPEEYHRFVESGSGPTMILPPAAPVIMRPPDIDQSASSVLTDGEGSLLIESRTLSLRIRPALRLADGRVVLGIRRGDDPEELLIAGKDELVDKKFWREHRISALAGLDRDTLDQVAGELWSRSGRLVVSRPGYDPSSNRVIGPGWIVTTRRVQLEPALLVLFGRRYSSDEIVTEFDASMVNHTMIVTAIFDRDTLKATERLAELIITGKGKMDVRHGLKEVVKLLCLGGENRPNWPSRQGSIIIGHAEKPTSRARTYRVEESVQWPALFLSVLRDKLRGY